MDMKSSYVNLIEEAEMQLRTELRKQERESLV